MNISILKNFKKTRLHSVDDIKLSIYDTDKITLCKLNNPNKEETVFSEWC